MTPRHPKRTRYFVFNNHGLGLVCVASKMDGRAWAFPQLYKMGHDSCKANSICRCQAAMHTCDVAPTSQPFSQVSLVVTPDFVETVF